MMKLIRYQTLNPRLPAFNHRSLLDEMDRLFQLGHPAFSCGETATTRPFPVDLYQDKNSVVVRAELPGFRKEGLQVQVADDTLSISAHLIVSEDKEKAKASTPVERTISLPENLDCQKVSANYENGVLTVTLPKRDEVKPTTVAVEVK